MRRSLATRVLGVDPSLTSTGYAVVEQRSSLRTVLVHGAIRTTTRTEHAVRLLTIYDELLRLIREWAPDAVAVEAPFVSENVRSAMAIGEVRAVVLLSAAASGLPSFEYRPAEVKQSVAGYGRSAKDQVLQMVLRQAEVSSDFKTSDAADAAAVALCHFNASQRSQLIQARGR